MRQALAELSSRGLDSERLHLRCWLGVPPALRAGRLRHPAAEARRLSLCGRLPEALRLFASLPAGPLVMAWRGEALLAAGDVDGALSQLEEAARLAPTEPWTLAYLAAARLRAGRVEGALEAAEALARLRPRAAAGHALLGVLHGQAGKRPQAEEALSLALERGRPAWVLGLRGAMRARWGELHGARADLDEAARRDGSTWILVERAEVARRAGEFWVALKDLAAAIKRLPDDPEPILRAAAIHLDQAQYAEALEKLEKALALCPADVPIIRQMARVRFIQGDLAGSEKDLRQALKFLPLDPQTRQDLAQMLIILEREEEARSLLEGLPESFARFWRGYAACRGGRYAEARSHFETAALSLPSSMADQARDYAWVSRVLEARGAEPWPAGKRLVMIGLGYRQLSQLTVAGLRLLAGAEEIYSNHSDPKVADMLGLFRGRYSSVVFRGTLKQAVDSSRKVMTGFTRSRRVAMVTRAQPLVYGLFARHLVLAAAKRRIPCRATSSVSIFDIIPSTSMAAKRSGPPASGLGVQLRDSSCLDGLDPSIPAVLFLPKSNRSAKVLERELSTLYPASHPCWILPGAGEKEFESRTVELSSLAPALEQSDPACTLYLPDAGSAAPPPVTGKRSVSVDGRVELAAVVAALARGEKAEPFARFGSHPAVAAWRKAAAAGLDDTLGAVLSLHLTGFPDLRLELEEHPWTGYAENGALRRQLPALAGSLAVFARETRFEAWLASRRAAHARAAAAYARKLDWRNLATCWERYTGLPLRAGYSLLLSPFLKSGLRANHVHGYERVYSVMGPEAGGGFGEPDRWKLWHELGRTALDPLLSNHGAALAASEKRWSPADGRESGASSWRHYVAEHAAQCVATRLWEKERRGSPPRPAGLVFEDKVLSLLRRYEKDRRRWPDLAAFYPVLLQELAR